MYDPLVGDNPVHGDVVFFLRQRFVNDLPVVTKGDSRCGFGCLGEDAVVMPSPEAQSCAAGVKGQSGQDERVHIPREDRYPHGGFADAVVAGDQFCAGV